MTLILRISQSSSMMAVSGIALPVSHFETAHFYDILGYGSMARTVMTTQNHSIASLAKTYERVAAKEWEKIMSGFEKLG